MSEILTYSGYCRNCKTVHEISEGNSRKSALELLDKIQESGNIDFEKFDDKFSTSFLLEEGKGIMFGVMTAVDSNGNNVLCKAFSGQFHGQWTAPGWVPPLLDPQKFNEITAPMDKKIKALTSEIDKIEDIVLKPKVKFERKKICRELMIKTHALYELENFKGDIKPLTEVHSRGKGVPTGTGDCCAPKLINYAVKNGLTPIGISEFYYGATNPSRSKFHGEFYSSCEEKCEPILGFMLCGLEDK